MNRKINSKNTSPMITALYCRLSLEDGKDNESMSISNQDGICQGYFRPQVRKSKNNALALLILSEIRSARALNYTVFIDRAPRSLARTTQYMAVL